MIARFGILALVAMCAACGGVQGQVLQSTSRGLTIALHVSSTIVGEPQTVSVNVIRHGRPVSGATTDLQWSMNSMPMADQHQVRLPEISPGMFVQRGFAFAMSGTWYALVTVRERQGETHSARYTLAVRD